MKNIILAISAILILSACSPIQNSSNNAYDVKGQFGQSQGTRNYDVNLGKKCEIKDGRVYTSYVWLNEQKPDGSFGKMAAKSDKCK